MISGRMRDRTDRRDCLTFSRAAAVTLLVLVATERASANDSSAELGAGGLVMRLNSDVEMSSEDLFISAREVRVNYIFTNRSPRDVRTLVAFPMPDVRGSEEPQSVPTQDPLNILGFSTLVDGAPVAARVEQKVFAQGIEQTGRLRQLGLPLAPHLQSTQQALTRLPRAQWTEFEKLGLGEIMKFDAGRGWQEELSPRWTLKTTYYWDQTFPANGQLRVEHRYRPAVGESAGTSLGNAEAMREDWFREYQQKYCMDAAFLRAIDRARRAGRADESAPFTEQRISYVLTTGANWAGPIRDFRLVVDKGDPANIVSFCGQGVKKISPTRFEMRYRDFTPAKDFYVLILRPVKNR